MLQSLKSHGLYKERELERGNNLSRINPNCVFLGIFYRFFQRVWNHPFMWTNHFRDVV